LTSKTMVVVMDGALGVRDHIGKR